MILQDTNVLNLEPNIIDSVQESEDSLDCFEDEFEEKDETTYQSVEKERHLTKWMDAWRVIHGLEGKEVECKNVADGKIIWKVVREVDEDKFKTIRETENKLFRTKYCPVQNLNSEFSEEDFAKSFWALWPGKLDEDVLTLQHIINCENKKRREKHLRPIRQVTKGEFIIFNALMIGSSVFAQSGQNLWNTDEKKNKVRTKLSTNANFGKYMKLWRFKELRAFIPKIMEDRTLKEKGDDWWQFKARMDLFNNSRKKHIRASHNLIFDESMSAYIPR